MRVVRPSRCPLALLVAAFLGVMLAACAGDVGDSTGPTIEAVRVEARGGKGGGGGDAGGAAIDVTGATPAELPRGIVQVDVTVSGAGFEPGSEVAFEIDGTTTDRIVTNAVTYVDETTLVANVDVALDAIETLYDVAVRNGPKKKGVGVDLLKVEGEIPTVEGMELSLVLPGMPAGELHLAYAFGDYVIGTAEEACPHRGFVFVISAGSYHCLDIPGAARVYPYSVNAAGRIAGTYYRLDEQSETGGYSIQHAFVVDWPAGTFTEIVPVAPYTEARLGGPTSVRSVNADGQVLVEFRRPDPSGGAELTGIGIVSADLGSVAVSAGFADGDAERIRGLSDAGWAVVGSSIWSGIDGDPFLSLPGTDAQNAAQAYGVTDDGRIYGAQQQNKPVVWATPFQEPVVVDGNAATTVKHTADGRLVTVYQSSRTRNFYCVSPSGTTVLRLPDEFEFGNIQTGIDGLVFGFGLTSTKSRGQVTSTRTPLAWDVSSAGGC